MNDEKLKRWCPIIKTETNNELCERNCALWDHENNCCLMFSFKDLLESILLDVGEIKSDMKKQGVRKHIMKGFK